MALAADVGAAVLPGVPAVAGVVARGGRAAKVLTEVATHADEVADAARVVEEAISHADEAAEAGRALEQAAEAVRRKPPVVIGEWMERRVNPYARKIGAETIDDWLTGRRWTPELNDEFIEAMKAEGREIIDIGPAFERRLQYRVNPSHKDARPPSPIYGRERQLLKGYPNYRRVYERFGKYWGGVPRLDY